MEEPVNKEESTKKRVDESWKDQVEREKHVQPTTPTAGGPSTAAPTPGPAVPAAQPGAAEDMPQARFDLFVSGLAMEAFIALGDIPHPTTRKQGVNLPQAKYLIDVLGMLEEKTRGNRSTDEQRLLGDALYQLRMRYLTKAGGS